MKGPCHLKEYVASQICDGMRPWDSKVQPVIQFEDFIVTKEAYVRCLDSSSENLQ